MSIPARLPPSPPTLPTAAVVAVGSLAFGVVGLAYPFGRDQGNYAYPAWIWLEGAMPYRDVFVFKPPGTVWVHALAQGLFGHSMLAIRLLDVAWTTATALVLADLARRWFRSEPVAALAGLFYAFLYANVNFWSTAQTDGWMTLPALLAVWLATRIAAQPPSRAGLGGLVLAGGLLGAAMCLKYTAMAFLAPLFLVLWAGPRQRSSRLAAVGIGVAAALGATWLWLALRGAIPGFLDSQLTLVPAYVEQTGRGSGIVGRISSFFTRIARSSELELALVAIGAGILPLARSPRGPTGAAAASTALLLAGIASIFAQNKFFLYHFLSLLPGAALFGAVGVVAAYDALATRSGRLAFAVTALGAVGLLATSHYPARWWTLAQLATGRTTLAAHWDTRDYRINQMSVTDNLAVAAWIAHESAATDRVFVWAFDPMINYVAERKTVSRFLYHYPLVVSWGDNRYEAELLGALSADPPRLFVVGSNDATPTVTGTKDDSRALLKRFSALSAFVDDRYDLVERVTRFDIYRLREE